MLNKTIVVTGGAGYLGSHTIIELIRSGFSVISMDDFSNSSVQVYDRIAHITGQKINHVDFSLVDRKSVFDFFQSNTGIVGVIHFAAHKSVPESVLHPGKYYYNNINSLLNVMDACLATGVQHFIFSSSCSVYGNLKELPVKEETPFEQAESPYAFTKQIGEQIIRDYCIAHPTFHAIALRYFNPVGAHVSGLLGELPVNAPANLVPVLVRVASGKMKELTVYGNDYPTRDGSCIRDYVHVTDIADAHVKALELLLSHQSSGNHSVYNLGKGEGVSVLEAIHSFEHVTGKKLNYVIGPRRSGDVAAIYSDSLKANRALGWSPRFTLDDMMRSAWAWEQQILKEDQPV